MCVGVLVQPRDSRPGQGPRLSCGHCPVRGVVWARSDGLSIAFSASGGVRFIDPRVSPLTKGGSIRSMRMSRTGKRNIETIQCHYCHTQTPGIEILPGKVLHLCPACYDEIQQTLDNSIDFLPFVNKVLNELNIPAQDRGIIAEALVWTEERKQVWNALLGKDRRLIRAIIHVLKLFDDHSDPDPDTVTDIKSDPDPDSDTVTVTDSESESGSDSNGDDSHGDVFVHLPRPIVRCIRRCSRAALFTAMGECLHFALGDYGQLKHIMEIFDYEQYTYELPPDPLWPLIENGSRNQRISVILECLDVLMGTNGLARIKKIRSRHKKHGRKSKRLNRNSKKEPKREQNDN